MILDILNYVFEPQRVINGLLLVMAMVAGMGLIEESHNLYAAYKKHRLLKNLNKHKKR